MKTTTKNYETIKGLAIALKKEENISTGFSLIKTSEKNIVFGQMTFNHIKHNTNHNWLELSYKLDNDVCINAMIISNFVSATKTITTTIIPESDCGDKTTIQNIEYTIYLKDTDETVKLKTSKQI